MSKRFDTGKATLKIGDKEIDMGDVKYHIAFDPGYCDVGQCVLCMTYAGKIRFVESDYFSSSGEISKQIRVVL